MQLQLTNEILMQYGKKNVKDITLLIAQQASDIVYTNNQIYI